jgi:hypothetical protein
VSNIYAIVVPLLVLALSGCGYLAVCHPGTYRTFVLPLFAGAVAIGLMLLGYAAGAFDATVSVSSFLKADSFARGFETGQRSASNALIAGLFASGFGVAVWFLGVIGDHIEKEKGRQNEEDDNGK